MIYKASCAALAVLLSMPAMAGTITGEIQYADPSPNKPHYMTYRIDYGATAFSAVAYGAQAEVLHKAGSDGALTTNLSVNVGPNLPPLFGFRARLYGEIGVSMNSGEIDGHSALHHEDGTYPFWGVGVRVSHKIAGRVSADIGLLHRQAFAVIRERDHDNNNPVARLPLHQNRINAGLALDIGDTNRIGVEYYRTTGTWKSGAVGISFAHAFGSGGAQ